MGTDNDCPLFAFFAELKGDNADEHAKLLALLQRSADHGTPKNKEKCRHINNEKFFEFKTPGGARVMAFWDQDSFIVCSHGFMKQGQKTPKRELKRARDARETYFGAKKSGRVRIVQKGT